MAQKGLLTTADYLPEEQYKALIDGLHKDAKYIWELYCRISFWTACRSSDVLKLKWEDIIDKTQVIVKEKKTGKQRIINFNEDKSMKIRDLYILLGEPQMQSLMFESPRGGSYTVQRVNQLLKDFARKYKITVKCFSTHSLRKTFGRHVYDSSGRTSESLILLNSILKHSSVETTKVYIGIRQDEIANVYDSLNI